MFEETRHYPLPDVTWRRDIAEQTIQTIVQETIAHAESGNKWPEHPMDDWGSMQSDFYVGRSGALWAVDYLQRVGAVDSAYDVHPFLADLLTENLESYPQLPHSENSSYLFGELPLLMMQYLRDPSEKKADAIAQSIQKNDNQPVRELMWGMAGSMVAALLLYRQTGDERWANLFRNQANLMLDDWDYVDGIGYLWHIEVYGNQQYLLGPVHGFAGNALPLIEGMDLLTEEQRSDFVPRVMESTVNSAMVDDQYANWRPELSLDGDYKRLPIVQYCHGAPGMVIALANLPTGMNEDFDEVLLKGGELVWHAGPLKKGSNLCHGTGGNGYAFLKLFERTGDERWLERARQFAMHAIKQYEISKELYRQPRYTLWTGDPGLAIYLWDCIQEQARFPTIDAF